MERKEIVIDGSAFTDAAGFFETARRALTTPENDVSCRNLSAFADLLRGGFGVFAYGDPITIRLTHAKAARAALGHAAAAAYWDEAARRCHPSHRARLAARAEAAARGQGDTFFETVLAILLDRETADCAVIFEEE